MLQAAGAEEDPAINGITLVKNPSRTSFRNLAPFPPHSTKHKILESK